MTDPRADLKYRISSRIVQHIAEVEGMTVAEYGSVYDAEGHEQMLNDLMRIIADHPGATEAER